MFICINEWDGLLAIIGFDLSTIRILRMIEICWIDWRESREESSEKLDDISNMADGNSGYNKGSGENVRSSRVLSVLHRNLARVRPLRVFFMFFFFFFFFISTFYGTMDSNASIRATSFAKSLFDKFPISKWPRLELNSLEREARSPQWRR